MIRKRAAGIGMMSTALIFQSVLILLLKYD